MWVVPVVPWVEVLGGWVEEVLRWKTGGTGGWVEVLVVGAHYGGWKGARTIYAD